jgi:hypothetical protein
VFLRKFLHSIFLLGCSQLFSQSAPEVLANGQELNVLYRHERTFKIFAHSRGFGLGFRRGKHVTAKTKSLFEIEALNLKHPKEIKVKGSDDNSKRFIYGKINNVGMFRIGTGFQNVIFKRADRKAIEIRCSYIIGGTVAIAKPYYVLVYRGTGPSRSPASVPYNSDYLTQDSIIGHGPFLDGINSMSIYPGLHGKFNLSFEYAAYSNWVRAIETGVNLDYFPRALPIMARNPAENIVITLYVGFVFGKKWF